MGVQEDFASVLGNCDDGATALAAQHVGQSAKVGGLLQAKALGKCDSKPFTKGVLPNGMRLKA